jgi:hypothetical protein
MPESGQPIARTRVRPWSADELRDPQKIQALSDYDQEIKRRTDGDEPVQVPGLLDPTNRIIDVYDEADDIPDPMEPEAVQDKADDYTDEAYDQLISAQVMLPMGEGLVRAQVIGRKRDARGNPIGTATVILYWIPAYTKCGLMTVPQRNML